MGKRFAFCFWLALTLCSYAEAQVGVIKGFVVDEQGQHVPDALVTWLRVAPDGEVDVYVGATKYYASNRNGHFIIRGLTQGDRYKIYAKKESAYYPNMTVGFFNPKDDALVATPQPEDKAVDITVHLGPKAGQLALNVRDAATGMPLSPTISVARARTGEGFGGGEPANSSFLVPADTDISFTVSAPGYEAWYYPGTTDEKQSTPLRVSAGEQKLLELQLDRKK
jgi:hypothetical protein